MSAAFLWAAWSPHHRSLSIVLTGKTVPAATVRGTRRTPGPTLGRARSTNARADLCAATSAAYLFHSSGRAQLMATSGEGSSILVKAGPTNTTKRATNATLPASGAPGRALMRAKWGSARRRTWEQFGNNSARTPGKTGEQGRPENKTSQQDRQPGPVCKTSIPGSNPGGASKILRKYSSLVLARHKRTLASVLESR